VFDHRIGDRTLRFGSPEWTDVVRAGITKALDTAGTGGGRVVVLNVPCFRQPAAAMLPAQSRNDAERVAAVNAVIADVAAARPLVDIVDYAGFVCPDGEYASERDGVELRYDGVHLTPDGAALTWRWLAPQLQALTAG
jgi:lysophospholipase L1-like esterase